MLEKIDDDIWTADGPAVPFLGIPYPTRMTVVRLSSGGLWACSPIQLAPDLAEQVSRLGPVEHLVAPNKIHHLFLAEWQRNWPRAAMWAAPGLARRRPDLPFDGELGDASEAAWSQDIDQVVVRGSWALQEVVFFHRDSRTLIVTDLIQRFDPDYTGGWRMAVLKLDGLVGPQGSTPREWRLTFWNRRAARAARSKILAWNPERLVIAHGRCAGSGSREIVEDALAWM